MADPDREARRGISPGAPALAAMVLACLLLAGCNRESIVAYDIPKAPPTPDPTGSAPPHGPSGPGTQGMPMSAPPMPTLEWASLPEGWTSHGPAGMRAANFTLDGPGDTMAQLAVIPLPGTGGTDLELVNLWRDQLGLPSITEAELPAHTDETTLGGETVRLFHVVRRESEEAIAATNQIVTATLRRDGFTWFFKMAGPSEAVDAHRESLKEFLAEVEIQPAPAMTSGAMPRSGPGTGADAGGPPPDPEWQAPDGWESRPPTQMVHSKWTAGDDGEVEITVSVFPGTTGGLVANLNRWRRQVALGPAPDSELQSLQDNLDVLGGKATLADFTGTGGETGEPARVMGVIVPRGPFTWFYKIMGPPDAVGAQRDAFVKFVQSVEYPSSR